MLTLPTRGLKYGFQGTINGKNLRKIAFHLPTGSYHAPTGVYSPLALPWRHSCHFIYYNLLMTPADRIYRSINYNATFRWKVDCRPFDRCDSVRPPLGERPFTEIFLSCESIVHILYVEVQDLFRHIAMNLSPKTTRLLATVKEYR